ISQTMVHWAQESFIQSPALVRAMFSLLHGQYDALGELGRALPKAYAISATSVPDTTALLECLGQIRSLLIVQMGPEEENLMIQSIGCAGALRPPVSPWDPLCHPGTPCVTPVSPWDPLCHPCVPCVAPVSPWEPRVTLCHPVSPCVTPCHPVSPLCHPGTPMSPWEPLCHPCVTPVPPVSPNVPLCPLMSPVPRAQVVTYLASCGLQSCPMLLAKGYPDIGWNPCGGEKYLDFLRFAVFVNGESVEENANVVVRLLIR
ncbi:RYR1 protein, partial [Gymnorhina tibicen]|nr:RYR1 protein [Gymnorhina tibicen]